MPATSSVSPTGNLYIDGVLTGTKWASGSLTYSFPGAATYYGTPYGSGQPGNNFAAFNAEQQAATRAILKTYASVANLTFTETTETSTQHGDLRFAESDAVGTAYAYYPSTAAEGGDAWFNNSSNAYGNPQKGDYAWLTLTHEIGHTLGLKHPHEANGSFGKMPADRDSLEYSVMSYHSYVGATDPYYTNEQWGYPQSLMMYDIAALQAAYGANYNTNAGNTTYSWSATTGEMFVNGVGQGAPGGNRIFLTIWDGGGADTYDFSNYATNLAVNLEPGNWTTASADQLANLGNGHYAAGNIANALLYQGNTASLIENVIGGAGNDKIVGNAANNVFTGGKGNDSLDGLGGVNTAKFSGNYSDYAVVRNADGTFSVTDLRAGSPDGTDLLKNIHYLQFNDSVVAGQALANAAPVAKADYYSTARGKKLTVSKPGVLANDTDANGDPLSASLVTKPKYGTVTLNKDGSFIYTPYSYFKGTDSFTYKVSDGTSTATATAYVKVGTTTSLSTAKVFGFGQGAAEFDQDQIPPAHPGDALSHAWSDGPGHGLQALFDASERAFSDWTSLNDLRNDAIAAVQHHDVAFLHDLHLLLR